MGEHDWRSIAIGGAVFVTVFLTALWLQRRGSVWKRRETHIEKEFRNVFALITPDRREALIQHYMQRHGVNRMKAMALAVDARQAEEERFR